MRRKCRRAAWKQLPPLVGGAKHQKEALPFPIFQKVFLEHNKNGTANPTRHTGSRPHYNHIVDTDLTGAQLN